MQIKSIIAVMRGVTALIAVLASIAPPAAAQNVAQGPVADFYRGKTITISVGFSVGGAYDLHARTLARVLGKHVPGRPNVIVKNAPGAAGLVLVNSLYNTLPKDGTELATFDRSVPLEPLLNPDRARFDALKLNWIGSTDNDASTCFAWHASPVKTLEDATKRELVVGGTGIGGNSVVFPRVLNAVLGTRFKVVTGYPGSAEVLLAMERGETEGFCSMGFPTLELARPEWVRDRKVNILVQLALEKNKDHPEVPLALDLAKTPADRQAIELVVSPNLFSRPFAAPPGVPDDRIKALRQAFDRTLTDPEYVADAAAKKLQVVAVKGDEIEAVLRRVYAMPKSIVERLRDAIK
jgi:tripartite-type tricarboxylate transporter receptor subunit TctC